MLPDLMFTGSWPSFSQRTPRGGCVPEVKSAMAVGLMVALLLHTGSALPLQVATQPAELPEDPWNVEEKSQPDPDDLELTVPVTPSKPEARMVRDTSPLTQSVLAGLAGYAVADGLAAVAVHVVPLVVFLYLGGPIALIFVPYALYLGGVPGAATGAATLGFAALGATGILGGLFGTVASLAITVLNLMVVHKRRLPLIPLASMAFTYWLPGLLVSLATGLGTVILGSGLGMCGVYYWMAMVAEMFGGSSRRLEVATARMAGFTVASMVVLGLGWLATGLLTVGSQAMAVALTNSRILGLTRPRAPGESVLNVDLISVPPPDPNAKARNKGSSKDKKKRAHWQ